MQQDTGNEDYYCWCGTQLTYLFGMNTWICPRHGLADRVYGEDPNVNRQELTEWPTPVWQDEDGKAVDHD